MRRGEALRLVRAAMRQLAARRAERWVTIADAREALTGIFGATSPCTDAEVFGSDPAFYFDGLWTSSRRTSRLVRCWRLWPGVEVAA